MNTVIQKDFFSNFVLPTFYTLSIPNLSWAFPAHVLNVIVHFANNNLDIEYLLILYSIYFNTFLYKLLFIKSWNIFLFYSYKFYVNSFSWYIFKLIFSLFIFYSKFQRTWILLNNLLFLLWSSYFLIQYIFLFKLDYFMLTWHNTDLIIEINN